MERMEVKFAPDGMDAKTGEFSGYGAFFGNADSYGDVIDAGAFKANLREWAREKRLPPMLAQHGGWGMGDMDGLPIGVWSDMEEDAKGLIVRGRIINLDTDRGKTIYGAMKEAALDGLSIGYIAKKFTMGTKPGEPRRKLHMIDLLEVSVVTSPANGRSRVASIKAAEMSSEDWRDMEASLRTKGLSRTDAVRAVSGFKDYLRRDAGKPETDPRDEGDAAIAQLLRANIATLKGGRNG